MGLCNGKIRYVGADKVDIAFKTASRLIKKYDGGIVTLIYGEDADENDAENLRKKLEDKFGDIEISVVNGGQPIYYFIISVE